MASYAARQRTQRRLLGSSRGKAGPHTGVAAPGNEYDGEGAQWVGPRQRGKQAAAQARNVKRNPFNHPDQPTIAPR